MKVWNKGVHTSPIDTYSEEKDPIKEKIIFWAPVFLTAMGEYFLELNYGENVKEILYREFCLKEGYNERLLYYGPKRKIVDCAIVLEYKMVLRMDNDEYGKYLAKLYIDRSKQFTELNIKDFNVRKYVEDLREFFKTNKLL